MVIKDFIEKINPKNNKIVLFSIIALILIIILIIMLNLLMSAITDKKEFIPVDKKQNNKTAVFVPDANDLKIPSEYLKDPEFRWRSFRTTPDKWDKEDIKRFWEDPADVIIEVYSEENKEYVKKILGGVH
ncbi:MAG: hypothetical protein FWE72_09205 [Spirochaetaceae bacterium]|nr:hypothetical protein [Spirochaetaceae bacterium]